MTYKVEVTETLQRVLEVNAGSVAEAIALVEEFCNEGTVELSADDFVGREIKPYEE